MNWVPSFFFSDANSSHKLRTRALIPSTSMASQLLRYIAALVVISLPFSSYSIPFIVLHGQFFHLPHLLLSFSSILVVVILFFFVQTLVSSYRDPFVLFGILDLGFFLLRNPLFIGGIWMWVPWLGLMRTFFLWLLMANSTESLQQWSDTKHMIMRSIMYWLIKSDLKVEAMRHIGPI